MTCERTHYLLRRLADAGATFVFAHRRGKKPIDGTIHTIQEALTWCGNVAILTGDYSAGLGAVDADADAGAYPEAWPALRNAIRIYRPDTDERCKWIVRGPIDYASRGNWLAGIDMIFAHAGASANAMVCGTHFGNAPYLWGGVEIPEFTAAELDAVFTWRLHRCRCATNVTRQTIDSFTVCGIDSNNHFVSGAKP